MVGAWGQYGADEAGSPSATASGGASSTGLDYYTQTLATFNPLITSVTAQISDPYRQVQILTVKLQQAVARGASKNEIATLQAKLVAAQHALALRDETTQSGRDWRNIGKVAAASGVMVAAAVTFGLLVWTFKEARRG